MFPYLGLEVGDKHKHGLLLGWGIHSSDLPPETSLNLAQGWGMYTCRTSGHVQNNAMLRDVGQKLPNSDMTLQDQVTQQQLFASTDLEQR